MIRSMSTRQILRTIIATAAGVIVAMIVIMAFEWIGHQASPVPPGPDPAHPDAAQIPFASAIAVLAGWFLGTLGGGAVANHLARRQWPSWIVVGVVLLGAIVNFATIRHPAWMIVVGIALPLIAGWIVSRRVPREAPEAA
jgi:hypothetical protein